MSTAVATLPSAASLQKRMEDQRVALQAWAVQSLPKAMTRGYRLALMNQDPKEIRQWVDLLVRVGGVAAERMAEERGNLSVFQFNFVEGQVSARHVPQVVEVPTREVDEGAEAGDDAPVDLSVFESTPPVAAMEAFDMDDLASLDELLAPD